MPAPNPQKITLYDVVARMIELTQQHKMIWRVLDGAMTADNLNRMTAVLETVYINKRMRLYQTQEVYEVSDIVSMISSVSLGGLGTSKRSRTATVTHLEIVNTTGERVFEFPQIPPVNDLLSAAQYQIVGVADFFKDLLGDEELPTTTDSSKLALQK
jgi:hypothetical protein